MNDGFLWMAIPVLLLSALVPAGILLLGIGLLASREKRPPGRVPLGGSVQSKLPGGVLEWRFHPNRRAIRRFERLARALLYNPPG